LIINRTAVGTNQIWFVQSTHAKASDAAGFGRRPDKPFATVDYLLSNTTALGVTANDTVVFGPGHNEGLAADQWTAAVAGLVFVANGMAVGALAPTLDFDNAATSLDITASNTQWHGIRFRPSVTAVLIAIEIANGVTGTRFVDCELMVGEDGAGVDEFVKGVRLVGGNTGTVFQNCTIRTHESAAGSTHAIHIDAASDYLIFDGLTIKGPWATNGILEDAAGAQHIFVNSSIDVTGTSDGFNASSTFAARSGNEIDGIGDDGTAKVVEQCVEKADGAVLNGTDDLFTITGGPVLATITGVVSTVLVGASEGRLQHTTTEPAATFELNAGAVTIDADAAGTSYRNVGATSVFTPDANGAVLIDPVTVEDTQFLLPIGTVKFLSTAAQTGNIKWYMRYKPLSPNSKVVAAA
jgi:hypothetical protein